MFEIKVSKEINLTVKAKKITVTVNDEVFVIVGNLVIYYFT